MCGRFTLRTSMPVLIKQFALFDDAVWEPGYNLAPTQRVPVVRGEPESGKRHLETLRWGLVPFWANNKSIGARMINARGETIAEKPSFRNAFKQRRCLVLADGYYEWKKTEDGKQPYYIRLSSDLPFAFAGLWERWEKGDSPLESCTIVTTEANALTSQTHDRMPVILDDDGIATWLAPQSDREELLSLIRPFADDRMRMDPVSRYVNNVRNQGPQCIELS